ncbi:MAG: sugar ABC transporter permease, partial [Ruminococcaceae bacterium]|nr:sugar ABC transporter permease [Oscillospiraceae bacterium]
MRASKAGGTVKRINRNSLRWDVQKNWQLYLLLLIPVIYIIVFAYFPMGGTLIAFKDYRIKKGVWGSPWVGFKHFENFFNTPNFSLLLKNTLSLSVYSLLAG